MEAICSYCQHCDLNLKFLNCGHKLCNNCFVLEIGDKKEVGPQGKGKNSILVSCPVCTRIRAPQHGYTNIEQITCTRHNAELTMYCCDCEQALCNGCKKEDHKRHRCLALAEASNEMTKAITRKAQYLEEKQNELKTYKRQADKCLRDLILSENRNKEKIRLAAKEAKERVIEECNRIIDAIEIKVNSELNDIKEDSRKMMATFNHKKEAIESQMAKNQELLEQYQNLLNDQRSSNNKNNLIDFFKRSATLSTGTEKDAAIFYYFDNTTCNWRENFSYLVQPSKTCSDYEIARSLNSIQLPNFDNPLVDILFYQNSKLLIGKSSSVNLLIFNVADESTRTVRVPKLKNAVLLKSVDIASVSENTFSVTSQKSNLLCETKFKGPLTLYLHSDDVLYLVDGSTHYINQSTDNGRTWTKLFRKSTEGLCSRFIVLSTDGESDKQRFWMIEGRPSVSSWQLVEYIVKGCSGKQRLTKVKIRIAAQGRLMQKYILLMQKYTLQLSTRNGISFHYVNIINMNGSTPTATFLGAVVFFKVFVANLRLIC